MRTTQALTTGGKNVPHDASTLGWLKKLGLIGFLFFFLKGMLWLILPFLLMHYGIRF